MNREANIPLFLWIATAVLAHLAWGGGADQAARVIEERLDVGRFAAGVRSHVRSSVAPPIEVSLTDDATEPLPESEPPTPDESPAQDEAKDEQRDPKPEEPQEAEPPKPAPPPKQAEPEPEPKPEAEKAKPPEPKDEKKPEAAPVQPELELPKRVAVKQHVADPNQKDNPDARYIADQANHVNEETQARITSADQNDPKPTPGSSPSGPKETPGNAEETHVRQDRDEPGERDRAPGGSESKNAERTAAAPPAAATSPAPPAAGEQGSTARPPSPEKVAAADRDQAARAATPENPGVDAVATAPEGALAWNKPQAATPEQKARKAKKRLPPRKPRSLMETLGLGAAGVTESGVNLNLTPNLAVAAIGADELSRLRRADGERRRSQHRGSWKVAGIERFRSAIENYVPSVKPGNQTALNTAAVPFASYLNQIHNRIHPIFADSFLSSLDSLPASHPMNDQRLVTSLEIVVDREEGRVVRRGVTRTSGVTAFDISAIDSVDRAGPFGTPPSEIVSPDGNVYLHWEFHRDQMACSTLNAHPFMLKGQPKSAPLPNELPPPFRTPEPGEGNDGRQGTLEERGGDERGAGKRGTAHAREAMTGSAHHGG